MRRVDRMDLEDEIGDPVERAVGAERGNHVFRRSEMDVKRRNELGKRSAGSDKSDIDEMIDDPAQADIREAQRVFPIVRDEQRSRSHDARFAPCRSAAR